MISLLFSLSLLLFSTPSFAELGGDIITLPTEPKLSLSQLQENCVLHTANLNYIKAEKNCTSFWKALQNQEESGTAISHIKMCGFYVGLLNERIRYETQTIRHQSLAQMVNSISETPHPLPPTQNQEEAILTLLKTFNINVNIKSSCKKAAYQNSGYAMEVLGDYYENAFDYEEAIYWYRRAIEMYRITPQNGGISAAYALGSLFALAPTEALRQPQKAAALLLQSVALGDDSFIGSYLTNKNCKNCLPLATRLHIQTFLKQQNLYTGYLDGDFGPQTIKGLMALYNQPHKHQSAIKVLQQQANHTIITPKFYRKNPKPRKRTARNIKKKKRIIQKKALQQKVEISPMTQTTPPAWLNE